MDAHYAQRFWTLANAICVLAMLQALGFTFAMGVGINRVVQIVLMAQHLFKLGIIASTLFYLGCVLLLAAFQVRIARLQRQDHLVGMLWLVALGQCVPILVSGALGFAVASLF